MAICRHRLGGAMPLEEWEGLMDEAGCCRECGGVMDEKQNLHAELKLVKAQLQEAQEAMEQARDALIWTSGSFDFSPNGQARKGWERVVKPAIAALNALKAP